MAIIVLLSVEEVRYGVWTCKYLADADTMTRDDYPIPAGHNRFGAMAHRRDDAIFRFYNEFYGNRIVDATEKSN